MSRPGGLGHPFWLFMAGQTVNGTGSMVTSVALPLVAVQLLHAPTFDVGLLEAVEWAPAVAIGLPAGALIDRHPHRSRPVMMAASIGQAAAIASVPASAAAGRLSLAVLLAAALAAGCAGVFFRAGYPVYLRQLSAPGRLVAATAHLQTGQSAARISGPALGGALAQAVGPAGALLADAASFLASFAALWAGGPSRSQPPPDEPAPGPADGIREGLRHLRANPLLRTVSVSAALANLFLTAFGAIEIVFLVRTAGVPAGWAGVLFGIGGAGGLAGALAARRLCARLGTGRVARAALALTAPAALLIPLTRHGPAVICFAAAVFTLSGGISIASVTFASLRLLHCPAALLGRISAASQALTSFAVPAGALLGAGLGQIAGTRLALFMLAAAYVALGLAILGSPLRQAVTPGSGQVNATQAPLRP